MRSMTSKTFFTLLFLASPLVGNAADGAATPSSSQLDDNALTFKVKTVYVNDPILLPLGTKIEVKEGIAYLNGVVPDEKTKQRLEKIPLSVEGIKGVKSSVRVQNTFVEMP